MPYAPAYPATSISAAALVAPYGVSGPASDVLGDRAAAHVADDRIGRREHEASDARAACRLEQAGRDVDVGPVELGRPLDRAQHGRQRSEMDDRVDSRHRGTATDVGVAQVPDDVDGWRRGSSVRSTTETCRARFAQRSHDVPTDEAGPSGDQDAPASSRASAGLGHDVVPDGVARPCAS